VTPDEVAGAEACLPGPRLLLGSGVRFSLWAPAHPTIRLAIEGRFDAIPMQSRDGGWHVVDVPDAGPGTLYRFVLPDGLRVPDPASRFQPWDVHGPSMVVDPDGFGWTDWGWRGRPWHEAVVYELHVGTFTPEGTFRAAIERLDHLRDLGITAIEIMPIADFPGARNWGYDGALLYAPDSTYGTPEDLKALVDAAHARGIMVLLDVVYNHFGPDGNYLSAYAPGFFTDRHKTPWGDGIHFEANPVRDFVIGNAVYWITEFHLDGLRLDAVHAIMDDSKPHILEAIAGTLRALDVGRPLHLVLENEGNTVRYLERDSGRHPRLYTAQWNDDAHHVLHVAATGESEGYYAAYASEAEHLGRTLAEGFAYQGEMMAYRGHPRGEPSAGLTPDAFVAFIQNHDQIGNRAFGERIIALASQDAVRAIAAVYLLLPQVPMLFMGEEWGAPQPFPFFCDFHGELAEAVREGRRNEFARFAAFQDPVMRSRIPDPQAEATFLAAKLDWNDLQQPDHAGWLAWYRSILAIRKAAIMPRIPRIGGYAGRYTTIGRNAAHVQWLCGPSERVILTANLSAIAIEAPPSEGHTLHVEGAIGSDGSFAPWTVRWAIAEGAA
jgi:malto-oligosyltrehalose trehalohydrolase